MSGKNSDQKQKEEAKSGEKPEETAETEEGAISKPLHHQKNLK